MEHEVAIPVGDATLDGSLALPDGAAGIVAFAHGSGSSRYSPRNRLVAETLVEAGLATLLFDLLTGTEEAEDVRTHELRFDIRLLARRLTAAADWLGSDDRTRGLTVGLFGASTGAAAALTTAAERPARIRAVVSRGGRPDLADSALERVRAPTLLIVGGEDRPVIDVNRRALRALDAIAQMEIVVGATHLFEERGALELVAQLARDWFLDHLRPSGGGASPR